MSVEVRLGIHRGQYFLKIAYTKREWETLEKSYIDIGLEKRETENGLGQGLKFEYYRIPGKETEVFREAIRKYDSMRQNGPKLLLIDHINYQVVSKDPRGAVFNLAIFRIVPKKTDKGYEVYLEGIHIEEIYNKVLRDIGLIGKLIVECITGKKHRAEWIFKVEEA
jgi:hypothetical protein